MPVNRLTFVESSYNVLISQHLEDHFEMVPWRNEKSWFINKMKLT